VLSSTGLTELRSSFRRTDVIMAVAEAAGASCTAREIDRVADRFLTRSDLVRLAPPELPTTGAFSPGHRRAEQRSAVQAAQTTRELLAREHALLTWAVQAAAGPPVPMPVVARAVAAAPHLSDEQIAMVTATCTSVETVLPIAGRPGSGKTVSLNRARHQAGLEHRTPAEHDAMFDMA
jgi:hypothetical protein